MTAPSVRHIVETLAALDLADWAGLPSDLRLGALDEPPSLVVLGEANEEAELVFLADAGAATAAVRAWLRDGRVVLVQLTWAPAAPVGGLGPLGAPAARLDVTDGLIERPEGEWVYPARGLAAVVDATAGTVHHVVAFVPTTTAAYRRSLRPDLSTHRRPLRRNL